MSLITTADDVTAALAFIHAQELLAYDTETTGLNVRKDKVIGFGFSSANTSFYVPILAYDTSTASLQPVGPGDLAVRCILQALAGKQLLMFNASFDARVTKSNFEIDLLPALHADVLLMKHTCDEEFPFGLKEIAVKLFGLDATIEKKAMLESIKSNGGTANQFFRADTDILAKYCIQDCLLTFRLYEHFSREINRQGLHDFYYRDEVLPLYKEVTIPMEERGVALDIPKMQGALTAITSDLRSLEQNIITAIEPHLATFTVWFLNKDYPTGKKTGRLAKKLKTEPNVIKAQYALWLEDADGAPMFNILSKHHLKKLFFDTLGEKPLNKTPTGLPQVDEEFLESIASKYTWVSQIIEYNKLTKLKGTYIERLLEESENGRFYPSFMQHRTVSGRYAGDLQQLPRPIEGDGLVAKYTNIIREFIIADNGGRLLSADYEQLEPSIFAHTSGDKALQRIFTEESDFYSEVAIRTERLLGVSSSKTAENYLGKVNKHARQKAKAYSLGIAYGMTGYKLKFEIGVDDRTADKLVADYLAAFPDLARWMNSSKDAVKYKGQIRTQSGRVRHMPQAAALFRKYGERLSDSLQLWKDFNSSPLAYEQAKIDHKIYKNLLNNSINFQVQGLAASIVNRASIAIARELKRSGLQSGLCMQVHDELVLACPEQEIKQVSVIVKHIMESVVKLDIPLRTTPQSGANFRECK